MKSFKKTNLFVILIIVFGASMIFNYLAWVHFQPSMGAEIAPTIRKEIIQAHSVLLGILIGGLFARPPAAHSIKPPLAMAVLGAAAIWVLYIGSTWLGYPETIGANGPNGLIVQFNDRATELSTLVSGALAYLCGKGQTS